MATPIRFGLIGSGFMGRAHSNAWASVGHFFDLDPRPVMHTVVGRNADGTLIADDGKVAKTRFEAVNRGWVSITRPWHLLTTNSGSGYPHAATAEKGRRMMDAVVERLAPFLVELSAAKLDEKFPF